MASHIGNFSTLKLFQILASIWKCATNMLHGGYHRNPKIHGGVETKLGGFQGSLKEAVMEYDGGNNIVP